jgi:hypothetical protein
MQNKGLALMGIGFGEGEHRALEAATAAISSPLLEDISINGATGIIINITGASSLTLHEVNEATSIIQEAADEDAQIIFGTVLDESMNARVKVTVVATGLDCDANLLLSPGPTATTNKAAGATASAVANSSLNNNINAVSNNNSNSTNNNNNNNNTNTNTSTNTGNNTNTNLNNGIGATSAGNSIPVFANPSNENANNNNNAGNNNNNAATGNPGLDRAREIARRLGMMNDADGKGMDVPAFMRRNQENIDNA